MGFRHLLWMALLAASVPAVAEVTGETPGECVPYARKMSGIQIFGDAWTWWDQADGVYKRGQAPKVGSVLVFRPSGRMRLGHVAVVSRIVAPNVLMITHANWSRIEGERGWAERDVTLVDVSDRHDWSQVRVWYNDNEGLGGSTYPTYGFIYGDPGKSARNLKTATPSARLTGPTPDIVGAIIDSLAADGGKG